MVCSIKVNVFYKVAGKVGEVAEWFKAVDCKSTEASHRGFESHPLQLKIIFGYIYI